MTTDPPRRDRIDNRTTETPKRERTAIWTVAVMQSISTQTVWNTFSWLSEETEET